MSRRRRRGSVPRLIPFLVLLVLVIAFVGPWLRGLTEVPGGLDTGVGRLAPAATEPPTRSATVGPVVSRPGVSAPPPTFDVDPQFSQELRDFLHYHDGTYGVAVAHLMTGTTGLVNAEESFITASLYKLFLMYEVMRQAESRLLALDDTISTLPDYTFIEPAGGVPPATRLTIRDALRASIRASSNAASLALLDRIGPVALNEAPGRLGLKGTRLDARASGQAPGHYFVDGVTTPTDLLTFFVALDAGRLVGTAADAEMQEILLGQRIVDRLPSLLPPGARVAHKTGDLDHSVHDAGIVYVPAHRFAIVVLSRDVPYDDSKLVIAEVARASHERLTR